MQVGPTVNPQVLRCLRTLTQCGTRGARASQQERLAVPLYSRETQQDCAALVPLELQCSLSSHLHETGPWLILSPQDPAEAVHTLGRAPAWGSWERLWRAVPGQQLQSLPLQGTSWRGKCAIVQGPSVYGTRARTWLPLSSLLITCGTGWFGDEDCCFCQVTPCCSSVHARCMPGLRQLHGAFA